MRGIKLARLNLKLLLGIAMLAAFITAVLQAGGQVNEATAAMVERRVNVPYTSAQDGQIPVSNRAIFWFGQVGPTDSNYVDGRLIYNDDYLYVTLHVFDRLLFYKKDPAVSEMIDWDAATLYLDLDGNPGAAPDASSYRFMAQLNFNESRDGGDYQAAYRGNGSGWDPASLSFATLDGWRGNGFNDTAEDRGWNVTFKIPYGSLGLAGKPPAGTTWRMAAVVHDRDSSSGSPSIPDTVWPESFDASQPTSWGHLRFGLRSYDPPSAPTGGTVTIRNGLSGVSVADGQVGGDGNCGDDAKPDYWANWGDLNYASGGAQKRLNVQNQWDTSDWPCFSKYYATFPLDLIPDGAVIKSARLTLWQYGNSNQGGSYDPGDPPDPSLIQVLTVAEDWNEAALTWNNAPLAVENVAQSWVDPLPSGTPDAAREWDVSLAVAEAYGAGAPLRIALYSADGERHSGKYFRSSDMIDAPVRPTLEVEWGEARGFIASTDPDVLLLDAAGAGQFTVDVSPTGSGVNGVTVEVDNPAPTELAISPGSTTLSPLPDNVTVTVTDQHAPSFSESRWYTLSVTVTDVADDTAVQSLEVYVLVNGKQTFLPLILRP